MKPLFICLGNVARSQMAEGYYNFLTDSNGKSAGCLDSTPERFGTPIPEIVEVMQEEGIDVSKQKVKLVTKDMVDDADKVFVFNRKSELPSFVVNSEKVVYWPVEDPYGLSMDDFRRIRDIIKERVESIC